MKFHTAGIALGDKVNCRVSGFEGIVTSIIIYLNGCVQCCVTPKIGADGKHIEGMYVDIHQLELIERNVVPQGSATSKPNEPAAGGPPVSPSTMPGHR